MKKAPREPFFVENTTYAVLSNSPFSGDICPIKTNIMKKHFLFAALIAAVGFTSCDKEETPDQEVPQETSVQTAYPQYDDADGILVGIKSITKQETAGFPIEIELGTAVAAFFDGPGSTTLLDAGTVELNESSLSKQSNNSYVFIPSATDFQGIDFSGGASWEVSGNGEVDAISDDFNRFPGTPELNEVEDITKGEAFTVSIAGSVSSTDSILVVVSSQDGSSINKTFARTQTSFSFTATESGNLNTGTGLVQVVPYAFTQVDVSGKNIYFINETVVTQNVTIK